MASLNQAKIAARLTGVNRLGLLLSGRPKAAPALIRSFATTIKRQDALQGQAWAYRHRNPEPKKGVVMTANFIGTFVYWWIFFHIFTEPGHLFGGSVFGEFDFPNPEEWTDEELGIPPDDYEE